MLSNEEKHRQAILIAHPVYFVRSTPNNDNTTLVAVDVQLRPEYIEWFDTNKDRRFGYDEIKKLEDESLCFSDPRSGISYQLTPLSLDLYEKTIRPKLLDGRSFKTTEEMLNALLATKESS